MEQLEMRQVLAYLVPILESVQSLSTGQVTYQQTNNPLLGDTTVYQWSSTSANIDYSSQGGDFKYYYSSHVERDTWEVYSPGGLDIGGLTTLTPDQAEAGLYEGRADADAQLRPAGAYHRAAQGSTRQEMSIRYLVVADANDLPDAVLTISVQATGGRNGSGAAGYSISGPISHSHQFTIDSDYLVTSDSRSFQVLPGAEFTVSWYASAEISGGKDHKIAEASVHVVTRVRSPNIYVWDPDWDYETDGVGGVTFSYGSSEAPLTGPATIELFWAENEDPDSIIGGALHTVSLPARYDSSGSAYVSAAQLGAQPPNANYLLAVADRAERITESSELDNISSLKLQPDVAIKSAQWVENQLAMEFSYWVYLPKLAASPTELPVDTKIEVYWASNDTPDAIIGNRVYQQFAQKTDGHHGPNRVFVSATNVPAGATHLIIIADRENDLAEADEENNFYVLPLPDLEPNFLQWNQDREFDPSMRGLDFGYQVLDADATRDVTVGFYWADGPNYESRIGEPVIVRTMEESGMEGYYGIYNEPARWGKPPASASHILLVVDPFNDVTESNEDNNVRVIQLRSSSEVLSGAITYEIFGHYLHGSFKPGQGEVSMSEAEVALGVDHFNWEQLIVEIPAHWTLVHSPTGGTTATELSLPIHDPATTIRNANELVIVDDDLGVGERFGDLAVDAYPYYYHEPAEIHEYIRNWHLNFEDSPRFPARFIQPDDFVKFRLRLVGVSYTTSTISLPGVRAIEWKSNSVYDDSLALSGGGVFMRVTDDMQAPNVVAGGVYELVEIEVIGSPPVAEAGTVTTPEDTSVPIGLVARDDDGDELTYTIVTPPSHGTLSGVAPNLIYMPLANYFGPDSFSYRVQAGGDDSNVAVVSLTVTSVNDPATNVQLDRQVVFRNLAGAWIGPVRVSDPDSIGHAISVDDALFEVRDGQLYLKPGQVISASPGSLTISITATDAVAPLGSLTRTFTLDVQAPPASWLRAYQWAPLPLDVDADGRITPLDALLVINEINRAGIRELPTHAGGTLAPFFVDVSGDGLLNPLDALLVINYINTFGLSGGEAPSAVSAAKNIDESQGNEAHLAWLWDYWFSQNKEREMELLELIEK